MMHEFDGKVALITGAGYSPGREIALAYSLLGGAVAANDINPINLDKTVTRIHENGGNATGFVFDIARRMPIEAMLAQVVARFGQVDVLINAASVKPDELLLEMDEWEFHRTLDVNLGGPFFCIQQVGRLMQVQGGGNVVNVISAAAQNAARKGQSAYLASQAGLVGLMLSAAPELAAHNIRINTVCDNLDVLGLAASQDWDEAAYHQWLQVLPVAMPGNQPELVSLVMYLCSRSASALTGKVIPAAV